MRAGPGAGSEGKEKKMDFGDAKLGRRGDDLNEDCFGYL